MAHHTSAARSLEHARVAVPALQAALVWGGIDLGQLDLESIGLSQ